MARKHPATIQDVAARASVSVSTVSRVLTGSAPVAEEKRKAILQAVKELNYRPNVFAQALAGGQSRALGVLTQNIGSPFYEAIMGGVLQGTHGSGFSLIFADGFYQPQTEQRALETLLSRQVDGIIVLGGRVSEGLLLEIAGNIPVIVVGRTIADLAEQCLSMDQFEGGYRATQYLIELGHRRIAHITGISYQNDSVQRRKGYLQALHDARLEPDPELVVEGDFREQSGVMAVEMLLMRRRSFSAIFAGNDQMAYGALLGLSRRGIRVPDDVSVIGFDDQPPSGYTVPPLTTIRQPATEMGVAAGQAALAAINCEEFAIPEFPVELVVRESTSRAR
jgi:LacI family transcriptional regulator